MRRIQRRATPPLHRRRSGRRERTQLASAAPTNTPGAANETRFRLCRTRHHGFAKGTPEA